MTLASLTYLSLTTVSWLNTTVFPELDLKSMHTSVPASKIHGGTRSISKSPLEQHV